MIQHDHSYPPFKANISSTCTLYRKNYEANELLSSGFKAHTFDMNDHIFFLFFIFINDNEVMFPSNRSVAFSVFHTLRMIITANKCQKTIKKFS